MASIEKRVRDGNVRWYARYRDASDRQRTKTFERKIDADNFLKTVSADLLRGQYIDPDAGRITFKAYASQWLDSQTFQQATREAVAIRLRLHVYPVLGPTQLRSVKPSTIQAWLRSMHALAPSYQRVIRTNVSTIFSAAVDDELIAKNPCQAGSVRSVRVDQRRVVPWTPQQVLAVREALPARFRAVVTLGAGLGLRQGEIFGLSTRDVDFLRGVVRVERQVKKLADGTQLFGLPKGGRTREIPLSDSIRDDLASFLASFPAVEVSLPWGTPDGAEESWPLITTGREATSVGRPYFNSFIWKPALIAAGLSPTRNNGCHALRHFFASVLLDGGESIKAVSNYLGHSDPGFTLRTYTHLMPTSSDRTKRAIDSAFRVPVVYPEASGGTEAP